MSQFSVLLCSDSAVYGNSLKVAFEGSQLFKVLQSVPFQELVDWALRFQPDAVVLKLDDESRVPIIKDLIRSCPMALSVAIVEDPSRYDMTEFINMGLRGLLPIRLLPWQIVNAVELVVVAGLMCLPRINPGQMNNNHDQSELIVKLSSLTARERQIVSLLNKNLSNQEIAQSLCLSESTVKTHLRNIFRKLKVRNRSEAMSILYNSGSNGYTP